MLIKVGAKKKLILKKSKEGRGARWQYKKTVSSPPSTETPNLYLPIEEFLLKKTQGLIEQLLHIEGPHRNGKKDADTVSMGTPPPTH